MGKESNKTHRWESSFPCASPPRLLCASDQAVETKEVTKLWSVFSQIVTECSTRHKNIQVVEKTTSVTALIIRNWLWESFLYESPWPWLLGSQISSGHQSSAWLTSFMTYSSTWPTLVILHCNIHKIMRGCCRLPVPSPALKHLFIKVLTVNLWIILWHYHDVTDNDTDAWRDHSLRTCRGELSVKRFIKSSRGTELGTREEKEKSRCIVRDST